MCWGGGGQAYGERSQVHLWAWRRNLRIKLYLSIYTLASGSRITSFKQQGHLHANMHFSCES